MATTPVPAFIAPPDFPALSDRATGTYNSKAFAWAEAMQDTTGPNIHAIAVTAKANADDAVLSAAAAAAQVPLAAAQVSLATTQAELAASAATTAATTVGATQWVSGTTYTAGDCVWSPINQQVYRRVSTGAGTTDPSADNTNWSFVGAKPSIVRSTRVSDIALSVSDLATLVDISAGTTTQSTSPVSSLGNGWYCFLYNSSSNPVLLLPFSGETVNNLPKFLVSPGELYLLTTSSSNLCVNRLSQTFAKTVVSGGLLLPNTLSLSGIGTYIVPDYVNPGEVIAYFSGTGITAASSDGWTYRVGSGSSIYATLVGTGTKRVAGGLNIPPNVETSIITASSRVYAILDTGTDIVVASNNNVRVKKTTGTIVTSKVPTTSAGNTTSGEFLTYSPTFDKFAQIVNPTTSASYIYVGSGGANQAIDDSYASRLTDVLSDDGTTVKFLTLSYASQFRVVTCNYSTAAITVGSATTGGASSTFAVITPTTFLEVWVGTAGQALKARVNSVSGTSISIGTQYATSQTGYALGVATLLKLTSSKYVVMLQGTAAGTHYLYGLTVTGNSVTFSDRIIFPETFLNAGTTQPKTYLYDYLPTTSGATILDNSRFIVVSNTGYYVVKFSEGSLTLGPKFGITPGKFIKDAETRNNIYHVGSTAWSKLNVNDMTLSLDYTVTSGDEISAMFKEGFSSRELLGTDGNWYAYSTVLTNLLPLTPTIVLSDSKLYREVTL
jgi:hypothetical protein